MGDLTDADEFLEELDELDEIDPAMEGLGADPSVKLVQLSTPTAQRAQALSVPMRFLQASSRMPGTWIAAIPRRPNPNLMPSLATSQQGPVSQGLAIPEVSRSNPILPAGGHVFTGGVFSESVFGPLNSVRAGIPLG
jgi:hypothetical protein